MNRLFPTVLAIVVAYGGTGYMYRGTGYLYAGTADAYRADGDPDAGGRGTRTVGTGYAYAPGWTVPRTPWGDPDLQDIWPGPR